MFEYFRSLANKYQISLANIISIAINRYGIKSKEINDNRVRLYTKLFDNENVDFYAVCVNTCEDSPFTYKDNKLFLENEAIGEIIKLEADTCTATYFRNDKKTITFNSNSRSKCTGCKFCGTYNLKEDDNYNFTNEKSIKSYFQNLLSENKIETMSKIENITICTGCFDNENMLFEHLMLLNETFNNMNFKGTLGYIGSQLRDINKIKKIIEETNNFAMLLSIEKFTKRDQYMKKEKASLSLEQAKEILSYCKALKAQSTFLYILGLEDYEVMKKYFTYFKESINKFPIVQIFQNYEKIHESYRTNAAKEIEYYLKARELINDTFKDIEYKREEWECYRSLYYNNENGKFKKCRIKK